MIWGIIAEETICSSKDKKACRYHTAKVIAKIFEVDTPTSGDLVYEAMVVSIRAEYPTPVLIKPIPANTSSAIADFRESVLDPRFRRGQRNDQLRYNLKSPDKLKQVSLALGKAGPTSESPQSSYP
ncbi:hypothetical protein EVAR_72041_1 [Eumeta japonica]|uniref:Uncharacterized protein n=1 Tax=Eumeta variegata TaxID=151549 RepID=A0A4C1T7K0_EUMVA|nr:hypothetical protein EVAR_72041_1 [Eumeta japonica]